MYTLILIDCWDYSDPENTFVMDPNTPQLYLDIMRFSQHKQITLERVIFASYDGLPTEPSLIEYFNDIDVEVHDQVCTIPELFSIDGVSTDTEFIIGGQAFHHCVHHRPLGFLPMMEQKLRIFSHDCIVNTHDLHIDNMLNWHQGNSGYLYWPEHRLGFHTYIAMMENFVRDSNDEYLGRFFREAWPKVGKMDSEARFRILGPTDKNKLHSRAVQFDLRRAQTDFNTFMHFFAQWMNKHPEIAYNVSEQHKKVQIRFISQAGLDTFVRTWNPNSPTLSEYTIIKL